MPKQTTKICSACNGKGTVRQIKKNTCFTCNGRGSVQVKSGTFSNVHAKAFGMYKDVKCGTCKGTGKTESSKVVTCSKCRGSGEI